MAEMTASATVKGYPDVGLAVLRSGEAGAYRLWLLLRHLDQDGRGWHGEDDLRCWVLSKGLWSDRTTRRTLAEGEGVWWWRRHGEVCYASLERVCGRLGVRLERRPVMVPLAHFGSIGAFRASVLGSLVAGRPRTISNGRLAGLAGCSRRTVISHLQRMGVRKQANYVATSCGPRIGERLCGELSEAGYRRVVIAGRVVVARQLPNTYWADWEPASRGMGRRVLRACSTGGRDHCEHKRLFYDDAGKGARAIRGLLPGERLYVREDQRARDGGRLWQEYGRLGAGEPSRLIDGLAS